MSVLLTLLVLVAKPEAETALLRYEEALDAAIAAIDKPQALETRAAELLKLAMALVPAFSAAQPDCRAYLEAAATLGERWRLLGPESIERDFHEDGALPKGAPALCYHMKDLIVHPATILVLLAHEQRAPEALRRELDEARAHIQAVRALLKNQAKTSAEEPFAEGERAKDAGD